MIVKDLIHPKNFEINTSLLLGEKMMQLSFVQEQFI